MQVQRFDDGERQRYFADDDKQKLSDLVAQQRYEGAADMDANLADNIVRKGKRFRYSLAGSCSTQLHLPCVTRSFSWTVYVNTGLVSVHDMARSRRRPQQVCHDVQPKCNRCLWHTHQA